MKLIPAFGLVATLLVPRAVDAQGTSAAPVAPSCERQSQRLAESIRGSVKRGETFRQVTPSRWIFALNPSAEGWWLSVTTKGREDENLARLTPPWHGPNPRFLDGWNFRNAENTGPNDGSVNAPGELREFIFSPAVGREIEYRGSGTTSDDVATVRAFGRGWLFIDSVPVDAAATRRAGELRVADISRLSHAAGGRMSHLPTSRAALVAEIRTRLLSERFPRVTIFVIVAIAGGCAFLFSALTLSAGLHSMAVRYGFAALVGYLAFAALIRAWIAWQRGRLEPDLDLPGLAFDLPASTTSGPSLFTGGRSGGGGASASWSGTGGNAPVPMPLVAPPPAPGAAVESARLREIASARQAGSGVSTSFDADDLWPVVLAAVLALGAIVAVGFVVFSAPTLLAEVALDAGLMSTMYRRLRREDAGHWTGAVFRRTWLPALAVILFTAGAGYALQLAAPDARSIGGVIRSLTGE